MPLNLEEFDGDIFDRLAGTKTRHQVEAVIQSQNMQIVAFCIPMRLPCPECGTLHIDEGDFATKPHHTHACQHCGMVWRPAVENTVGVQFLPGFKNA